MAAVLLASGALASGSLSYQVVDTPDLNIFPVTATDLNNDGKVDLVGNEGNLSGGFGWQINLAFGQANGTFSQGPALVAPRTDEAFDVLPSGDFVLDITGDGNLDIVANLETGCTEDFRGYTCTDRYLVSLDGDGSGDFGGPRVLAAIDRVDVIGAADFDGDNSTDLAAITMEGQLWVGINDGAGSFAWTALSALTSGGRAADVVAADFNADGVPDLVVVEAVTVGSFADVYLVGYPAGGEPAVSLAGPFSTPHRLLGAGNFDGQPGDDVFVVRPYESRVCTESNEGRNAYVLTGGSSPNLLPTGRCGYSITDVDGDGLTDLVDMLPPPNAALRWSRNAGAAFDLPQILVEGLAGGHFGDVNGDGLTDITGPAALDSGWGQRTFLRKGLSDLDGDGIEDSIDADGGSGTDDPPRFDDGDGSFGEILDYGGLTLLVTDLDFPDGVRITTRPGTGEARVRVCGAFTLKIPAGSDLDVTCGSVTVGVVAGGPVVVELAGDVEVFVSIPVGVLAKVTETDNDGFGVEHLDGEGDVTVTIDGVESTVAPGESGEFSANVAPVIVTVTAPEEPVSLKAQPVTVSVEFTDPGVNDIHTCLFDWGDGSAPAAVDVPPGDRDCEAAYTYAAAGLYTATVTVTDDAGDSDSVDAMVVVYDPDGGYVTGGGWVYSAAGAYLPDRTVEGKASFGFVSRYKKGASVPDGNAEFQFRAGDLAFNSSSYEWLVVTGNNYAQFKGVGMVNDEGEYRFMIWARDGSPDTFRIKIWTDAADGAETVLYDNGFDQAIGGGNIVVHTKK